MLPRAMKRRMNPPATIMAGEERTIEEVDDSEREDINTLSSATYVEWKDTRPKISRKPKCRETK